MVTKKKPYEEPRAIGVPSTLYYTYTAVNTEYADTYFAEKKRNPSRATHCAAQQGGLLGCVDDEDT